MTWAEIIQRGIADLLDGEVTIPALLVSIGSPRLRGAGVEVPQNTIPSPEIQLYLRLRSISGDAAHSHYNGLIRRLVKYERSLETDPVAAFEARVMEVCSEARR
jgi:hypothetical protein